MFRHYIVIINIRPSILADAHFYLCIFPKEAFIYQRLFSSKMTIVYFPPKILFSLFGLNFYAHGIMDALGFIVFILVSYLIAKRIKLDTAPLRVCLVLSIFGGVLGSRLAYVLFSEGLNFEILQFFAIWNGGLAVQGGIVMSSIAIALYLKYKKLNVLAYLDVFGVSLFTLMAFVKIGCFLNGCCYGIESDLPWAMTFGTEIGHHPTQIYDLLLNLIFFVFCILNLNKLKQPGFFTGLFFLLHGISRFLLEFIRINSIAVWFLTWPQIFCIVSFALGAVIIYFSFKNKRVK
jgi:phosphatidylglycerol:prolipoprotein diacylglycerol transferase